MRTKRRNNTTQEFNGELMGTLVRWPMREVVAKRHFPYDDKGRSREDAWEKENAGKLYDTGEGGLECWALWPDVWNRRACCAEGHLTYHHSNGVDSRSRRSVTHDRVNGYHCSAAILLGTIGLSLARVGNVPRDGAYYWCVGGPKDLTARGRLVVSAVSALYGIEPVFATNLDT